MTVADGGHRSGARSQPERVDPADRYRSRPWRSGGYAVLALLAYVPPLLADRGRVAADTKQYLYLDPGRLLSRAASMWDPNIGFGTVTHQTIGYLFPMGPYYWLLDKVGLPDWVAQRLWLGSLIFAAGLGVLYLMRRLGRVGPGVVVAALAYMFSPYLLDYSARISVLLMPWAALGFLIAFVIDASRDGGWSRPALFALTVQLIGGVNATALLFALLGPALWLAYSTIVAREIRWRRAFAVTGRVGLLTVITSLWWAAGLSIQGSYGIDILKFTETVRAVSRTSVPGEVLRGLGYWFFYGQDRIGPWTAAASTYTQHSHTILFGYGIATLALLAATTIRWRERGYFVVLALVGTVIAVGAHPYDSPSPLGALFKAFANSSKAGLALRSTGRATPLVVLGLAALLGSGVDASSRWLRQHDLSRVALAVPVVVGALVLANFPPLWDGSFYGANIERPENIPSYWYDAAKAIDAGGTSTRVVELPGADFASYIWGNLVDPLTPGITNRPYVARELIPWGGPAAQNLLDAFDRRYQENVYDPRGVADVLRLMSAGGVVLRYDIQSERYNLIRPSELQRAFAATPGLQGPQKFGPPRPAATAIPETDERALDAPPNEAAPPSVALYTVPDARSIVRAESPVAPLVVAGDGEGLVDASDIGLLAGNRTVLYSGSYDAATLRRIASDGVLVLTDSNRKRAQRWSTILDNYGITEQANQISLATDESDARLDVFPNAPADAATVTDQQGVVTVVATAYGNPISYTPEDRAARAFDGDLRTAWKTSAFDKADGQKLRVVTRAPITTDHVRLVQPLEGPRDRYITQVTVRLDGHVVGAYPLDARSRTAAGQVVSFGTHTFNTMEIEVADTNRGHDQRLYGGDSAVGFAEIDLRDAAGHPVRVHEVMAMPGDLLADYGAASLQHPLIVVMARERQLPVPPRYDPELVLSREFDLPTARSFAVTGTVRLTSDVASQVLDSVLGVPDAAHGGVTATTSEFLAGCIRCRASAAIDGDPRTAWNTPVAGVVGQWTDYRVAQPLTFGALDLQIVADHRHSLPTRLEIQAGGETRVVDVPHVAEHKAQNTVSSVHVTFPTLSGSDVRIKVLKVEARRSANYFDANPSLLPVGIAEWGIPGLRAASPSATLPSPCRTDLLTVDGRPLPIRIVGTSSDGQSLAALSFEPCVPDNGFSAAADGNQPAISPAALALAAGRHVIESAPGRSTGINIDRLVLASDAGGAAHGVDAGRVDPFPAQPSAPNVTVQHNGRTSLTVRVHGASGPFWLVLGETQNAGWTASISGGTSLGGSTLIDGYANGWYVTGAHGDFTVHLDWTPQRRVWIGLAVSGFGAAACLALIALAWVRRRRTPLLVRGFERPVLIFGHGAGATAVAWPAALIAAGVSGLVAWAVSTLALGVIVAFLVIAVVRQPRRARVPVALVGPAILGLIGLYIAVNQLRYDYPPVFEWPTLFPRAYEPGWLALLAVVAVVVADLVRTHGRDDPGDLDDGDPPLDNAHSPAPPEPQGNDSG